MYDALDEKTIYPGTRDFIVDPGYIAGAISFAEIKPDKCYITGRLADTFLNVERNCPAVIENKLGKGIATLVLSTNYPGHPAIAPLYRVLMREFMTMSARECEIKVIGNDRVRYSVYEGNKYAAQIIQRDLCRKGKSIHKYASENV